MLRHPWPTRLPVPLLAPTPARTAAVERRLAPLDGLGLDADTMTAAFRAVASYAQGAVQPEVALAPYTKEQGRGSGDDTRRALAPQMTYLLGTGRYPTCPRYAQGAAREDDAGRQFETGPECVRDGVAGLIGRAGA
ncbi:TetR/AcrR family transcriptional regulator C-terminal domain-containing protein [Streptomyces sp. NPDC053513]|uniref:TetR/AcrR family transcriptional regulator C-terminal domain-containing protein n=1 Tax=unclassified Streptomyces TaxID=2593676 RepID=UPI0037D97508